MDCENLLLGNLKKVCSLDVIAGAFLTAAYLFLSLNSPSQQPMNYFKGFNQREPSNCWLYEWSLLTLVTYYNSDFNSEHDQNSKDFITFKVKLHFYNAFHSVSIRTVRTMLLLNFGIFNSFSGQKLHWPNGPKTSLNQLSKADNIAKILTI